MLSRSSSRYGILSALLVVLVVCLGVCFPVSAANSGDVNFKVSVKDSLAVSLTDLTSSSQNSGDVGTFLRNHIRINVASNNSVGFMASMTTQSTTPNLVHSNKSTITIPTLSSGATASDFPSNRWGYSIDDAAYSAVPGSGSTPVSLINSAGASSSSVDVYFGTKAAITQAAGSYNGVVVISIVSGVVNDNPSTPESPTTDSSPNTATYDSSNDATVYTTVSDTTTTSTISSGDNRSAYASPQGVIEEYAASNINEGSSFATSLAVSSAVAATTGVIFFVVAKRRNDDDDEEEDLE